MEFDLDNIFTIVELFAVGAAVLFSTSNKRKIEDLISSNDLLRKDREMLKAEIKELRDREDKLERRVATIQGEMAVLESQKEAYRISHDQLLNKMDDLIKENAQFKAEIKKKEDELFEYRTRMNAMQKRIKTLENELNNIKSKS